MTGIDQEAANVNNQDDIDFEEFRLATVQGKRSQIEKEISRVNRR